MDVITIRSSLRSSKHKESGTKPTFRAIAFLLLPQAHPSNLVKTTEKKCGLCLGAIFNQIWVLKASIQTIVSKYTTLLESKEFVG